MISAPPTAVHVHALLGGLDAAELAGRPIQLRRRFIQAESGRLTQPARRPGQLPLLQWPLDVYLTPVVSAHHHPGKADVGTQLQ
jgi:hypothetical protein